MNTTSKKTTPVKIYISSFITNITADSDSPFGQKGCAPMVDLNKEENCDEHIEFSTEGFISEKGDTVEITYKENAELGMADIESSLRFKKNRPNFVNLIRTGSAPASLVFDSHFPRQNCSYCIGNLPFSFCIITNEVKNLFDEFGGKIVLDYQIEMHGVVTEHNVYTLEYKK